MLANDGSYRDFKFYPIYLENQVFIHERLVEDLDIIKKKLINEIHMTILTLLYIS